MSKEDTFARVLRSLYDAMLDDAHWPATSALIDEVCDITGNALMVGVGPKDDLRALFVGIYWRGERREDLERQYLEVYHPTDERVPRVRQLPDSLLVHVTDLLTAEELRTSPTYNEALPRARLQDGLNVRLGGPGNSHISWALGNPLGRDGWGPSQIELIQRLLPHIRQFIRVRQALASAAARDAPVTALLDNGRIGVLYLDRRGRIMLANDLASHILRHGNELWDNDGELRARKRADQARLERLVAAALPDSDEVPASGSMRLDRSPLLSPFVVHVTPVGIPQPDYGGRHVAVLVLIVQPGRTLRADPSLVAAALGLTRAESQVAVRLAAGESVRDIAGATRNTRAAIYWHLQQIYQKLHISRQVDLVRLVLSIADFR